MPESPIGQRGPAAIAPKNTIESRGDAVQADDLTLEAHHADSRRTSHHIARRIYFTT